MAEALTEEEISLYDRQIRLWGFEAQQRISRSRILLLGMDSINMEVAKNLAAAGVAVLLVDDRTIDTVPFRPIIPLPASGGHSLTHAEAFSLCLKRMNKFVKVESIPLSRLESTIRNYDLSSIVLSYQQDLLKQIEIASQVSGRSFKVPILVVCTAYCPVGTCSIFSVASDPESARSPSIDTVVKELPNFNVNSKERIPEILRSCWESKNKGLEPDPMTASVVGGVIAQQSREYIENSGHSYPKWNVAIYSRLDTSITVYDFPKAQFSAAGASSNAETVHISANVDVDTIDD